MEYNDYIQTIDFGGLNRFNRHMEIVWNISMFWCIDSSSCFWESSFYTIETYHMLVESIQARIFW